MIPLRKLEHGYKLHLYPLNAFAHLILGVVLFEALGFQAPKYLKSFYLRVSVLECM